MNNAPWWNERSTNVGRRRSPNASPKTSSASPARRSPNASPKTSSASPARRAKPKRKGRTARKRAALARMDLAEMQRQMQVPPSRFQKFMRGLTSYLALTSAVPLPKVNLASGARNRYWAERAARGAKSTQLQVYDPYVRTQRFATLPRLPGGNVPWRPTNKNYAAAIRTLRSRGFTNTVLAQLGISNLPMNIFKPSAIANREKAAGRKFGPQPTQFIGYKPPLKPAELRALHNKGIRVPNTMLKLANAGLPLLEHFPNVPATNSTMRPAFVKAWPKFVNGTRWQGMPPPEPGDILAKYMKDPLGYRIPGMPTLPRGSS